MVRDLGWGLLCPASAFRASLAERFRSAGHQVHHQSGISGPHPSSGVLCAEIFFISVSLNVHSYKKLLFALYTPAIWLYASHLGY